MVWSNKVASSNLSPDKLPGVREGVAIYSCQEWLAFSGSGNKICRFRKPRHQVRGEAQKSNYDILPSRMAL